MRRVGDNTHLLHEGVVHLLYPSQHVTGVILTECLMGFWDGPGGQRDYEMHYGPHVPGVEPIHDPGAYVCEPASCLVCLSGGAR